MNTAKKGARNEHRSRDLLEAEGYRVTRAAGSLGAWDLVGIGRADVVLCQVRTRDWPSPAERAVLATFPRPPMTRLLLHRWRDGVTVPDVRELAGAMGIA